jgi:hypothetical protein
MHGRRSVETALGLALADCSLGAIAATESFVTFAGFLLSQHQRFRDIYNTALAEYRHANHIRSRTHPVPELVQEHEWQEVPFWIWTSGERGRRRAFVRQAGNRWELTDRDAVHLRARVSDLAELTKFAALLHGRGVKLRPRALITTMYARLVLSDLFIHGIGGAKYDELTDLIIRRFFGIEPPAYVTATATFCLPIDRPGTTPDDVRASARRLRELRYRPESFLNDPLVRKDASLLEKLAALAAEKREYLAAHDLRRCPADVFRRLDRLNETMHQLLSPLEQEYIRQYEELLADLKRTQLLASREFSFVLFPSEILPARLLDLCKLSS